MFEKLRFFPVLIGVLIAFSGLKAFDIWTGVESRFGATSAEAAAKDEDHADSAAPAQAADGATKAAEDEIGEMRYLTGAEVDVMNSMQERDQKLQTWEDELKMREQMLKVAEGKVEARIAELKALEANLRKLVEAQTEKEEEDLARLVKVYETMKPKDAAPIFERLDEKTQVAIASRMREAKLALIFANMDEETPKRLTALLMEQSTVGENDGLAETEEH